MKLAKNNKSGVSGVSFDIDCNKWRSYIGYHDRMIHLGVYVKLADAARARRRAERTMLHARELGLIT
jgi:hypothetical protein